VRPATALITMAAGLLVVATACSPAEQHTGGRDSGTDTASGDTDTATDDTGDTECEGIDFPVAGHPPSVMLVLDRSGSMAAPTPGLTPWASCSEALVQITAQMDYQIRFGLLLYPDDSSEESCAAPAQPEVPISAMNADQIAETLESSPISSGGTPTAAALQSAYEYLAALEGETDRLVVLATDGAPNCSSSPSLDCDTCTWTWTYCMTPLSCLDDEGTYGKVVEYHDFWGIDTYVIGVGGVWEAWDEVLTTIAFLGGTGDYYPAETVDGPEEIIAALQGIAAEATECTFDVDWSSFGWGVSQDPDLVNLLVDGEIVASSPDCSFAGGWHWLDEDTIELCPDLCHDYKWGAASEVHASFGCETVVE